MLDADGRRVGALSLDGAQGGTNDPGAVAKWLREAAKAPALERFGIRVAAKPDGAGVAALLEALRKFPGVESAAAPKEGGLLVTAKPGALSPAALLDLAAAAGVVVDLLEPVPVAFAPAAEADPLPVERSLAGIAGVWYAGAEGKGLRAWVARLLLDPGALEKAAPGYGVDVEARRYAIPGASLGPPGARIAAAVRAVPGVLSVTPALAAGTLTVTGRKGTADWPGVLAALRGVVPEAREDG